jgi:hypothetical protein
MSAIGVVNHLEETDPPRWIYWPAEKAPRLGASVNPQSLSRFSLILFVLFPLGAANAQTRPDHSEADANGVLSQGQQIASAVSTVTSTAISPLFGVCLLGAYQYFRTASSAKAALPFYSNPSFWIPISILLLLVLLKDTIGGAAPLLKKPLDALEVLVLNKASLILIAFPVMIHQIVALTGAQLSQFITAVEPVAYAADFSSRGSVGHVAAVIVGLVAGVVVTCVMWVIGHVFDVLCLLSPFPLVDLLLKGFRNGVVLALAVTTVLSPRMGLVVSLLMIGLGMFAFSKALRLSIMGSYFAWDLLRLMAFGHRAKPGKDVGIAGFSVGKVAKLPRNTLGCLMYGESGDLEFRYRLLGFGPRRRQRLDKAAGYYVGRGLLYPSVVVPYQDGARHRMQFRLLPRYQGREEDVCATLKAGGVRDFLLRRGWRRFLNWAEADLGTS